MRFICQHLDLIPFSTAYKVHMLNTKKIAHASDLFEVILYDCDTPLCFFNKNYFHLDLGRRVRSTNTTTSDRHLHILLHSSLQLQEMFFPIPTATPTATEQGTGVTAPRR